MVPGTPHVLVEHKLSLNNKDYTIQPALWNETEAVIFPCGRTAKNQLWRKLCGGKDATPSASKKNGGDRQQ